MMKVALRSERLYAAFAAVPILGSVVAFRLDAYKQLTSARLANRLYGSFLVGDGTSKETAFDRFRDIDARTIYYAKRFSRPAIHDVAVSSGITSVDLYRRLEAERVPFDLFISDKFARYFARGRWVTTITDASGRVVKAYVLGVLADDALPWRWALSKLLMRWVRARGRRERPAREILLYHPDLLTLLRRGQVRELDFDVFASASPRSFSLIRCMNLLNLSYFSLEHIRGGIDNLAAGLAEGGVLQIGSTLPSGRNTVSFYERVNGRLRWLEDLNGGYELQALLDGIPPRRDR